MSSQSLARLYVRINQIDYALVPPGDLDRSSLPRVPVIRIYGPSSTGQTACVHVHQVYPYLFVEYLGNLNPGYVKRYIAKLFRSLNHAIALSLKRNPHSHNSQYIRAIVLVKGVHFYGFHSAYSPFFKILVADPSYMNRISTILQSGSVMSTRFRVYESHLSFILQFLCDFGLYGCGFIELEDVFERCAQADQPELGSSALSTPIPFKTSSYFRESRLPLEVDAIAPHILNRHRLAARNVHHRLEIPVPFLPSEPLVLGVRELWEDERNRRQTLGLNPSPELPIDPSESSRGVGGDWVAEAHWWDEIRHRIQDTANSGEKFHDKKSEDWERFVMTTFESIEVVWEKEYKVWKPAKEEIDGAQNVDPVVQRDKTDNGPDLEETDNQIDVDISKLSNQDISELDQQEALGEGWNKTTEQAQQDHDDNEGEGEEEAALEDELAEELVDVNKVEDDSPEDPFLQSSEEARPDTPPYRLASPRTPTRPIIPERSNVPTPTKSEARPLSATQGLIEPLTLVSPDDRNGQLDEAIHAKFSVTFDEDVLLSVEKDIVETVDSENAAEQPQRPVFSGILTEKNSQDQILVQNPVLTAERRSSLITARAVQLSKAFDTCKATNTNRYIYSVSPPSVSDLQESFESLGLPSKTYQAPYCSKDADIPEMPKEYAGLTYRLKGGQGIATLTEWASNGELGQNSTSNFEFDTAGIGGWEYASHPPSVLEVRRSVPTINAQSARRVKSKLQSQIEGPTQANLYGFKTTPIVRSSTTREKTEMSIMSLEVFVATRDTKVPDPGIDEVVAVVYAHHISGSDTKQMGALALQSPQFNQRRLRDMKIEILMNELDLLNRLIDLTVEIDPDILTGWEVQAGSWGYLEARGQTHGLDISELISRATPRRSAGGPDQWGMRKSSTFKVAGRHVLNSWRIMRSEKTLTMYTFENVVFEILRRRVPKYSYKTLTKWYNSSVAAHTSLLLRYLFMRVVTNLELLEEAEIVTKTAEFARVFGVDFFSVISRGSQFKVESFMFRIAKPESFVLISPSRQDVGKQNAAECMPLIMEPASAFYSSPLVVLDFQSLYPSIMIAYNYCYSTCLGRVRGFQGAYKLGVNDNFDLPPGLLQKLQDHITVAANGIMYVKPNVRKGLLGRMLAELLDTRVMVKQAMKSAGGDKARKRILDARQLGLKYIANVTYGYTGATFSGRMPAVEIADSIVQSGRETLEKAIDVINGNRKWGAKVVYGDTDSVFIYLLGKTKEQAFAIGNEIAAAITAQNPAPIKLKFEKVYLPCVLMAKKRYVGFKYESIDDTEPVFDAKGIETVRRDGVLAQRKMVENCLKILFRTQDLSEIKDYCCRSWTKLLENKASVQDFIFAKEVRMGTYSDKVAPPPGVMVAARRTAQDPNDEAQYGDRIPYVIVRGAPGSRLVERAIDPLEFINNSQLHLDANYYITRVLIPPLDRIFNLLGADAKQWFNEMPKINIPQAELVSPKKTKTIAGPAESPDGINMNEHFFNAQCLSCGNPASQNLCHGCFMASQETISNLGFRIRAREERLANAHRICGTCTSSSPEDPIQCESLDCPWFYSRRKAEEAMDLVPILAELSNDLEKGREKKAEESEAAIDSCDEDFYMSESDATNEI